MKKISKLLMMLFICIAITGCNRANDNQNKPQLTTEGVVAQDDVFSEDIDQNLLKANKRDPLASRIESLEDLARYYAKNYGKEESAVKLRIVYDKLDATNPQNSDYLMGKAFLEISQGNNEAGFDYYLQAYNSSGNIDAMINRALFAKARENQVIYDESKEIIEKSGLANKIKSFHKLDAKVDEIATIKVNTEIPHDLPKNNNIFILLGYALNDDGTMQDTLIERLKVAKQALDRYPDTKIVVTGGVEKNGNTEGKLMAEWLIKEGIDDSRIIQENMARDTVENFLYSLKLIESEDDIKSITVISSATHIQRSVSLVKLADEIFAKRTGRENRKIYNTSWLDVEASELKKADIFGTTRDLLRTDGYWSFPAITR